MPFLSVFGHTNLDIQVRTIDGVNTQPSVQVTSSRTQYGGVAGNIARAAGRLGLETSLVSYVGDDFPRGFHDALTADGVDLSHFVEVPGTQSPTCWMITDKDLNQCSMIQAGPMERFDTYDPPENLVKGSSFLHITTGRPGYYMKLVEMAKKHEVPYSFDPAQGIYFDHTAETYLRLARGSSFLFMNEFELETVLKYAGHDSPEGLLELTKTVVITRGKEGSQIITRDGMEDVGVAVAEKVIDPTGAGDAFRAGFYLGLLRGWDTKRCARMGAVVGSFAVEREGPQGGLPDLAMADSRYRETFKD